MEFNALMTLSQKNSAIVIDIGTLPYITHFVQQTMWSLVHCTPIIQERVAILVISPVR